MDFCVKCGRKGKTEDYLCKYCRKPEEIKEKVKKERLPESKRNEYFEADIQLRNVEQEVIDLTFKWLEKHKVNVPKTLWHKNGVDIYVSERRSAKKVGMMLQERFGGMIRLTATLFSYNRITARSVYRVTMLFKQFPYSKGQEFLVKGKMYKLLHAGKDVLAYDIEEKKRVRLKYEELERNRLF